MIVLLPLAPEDYVSPTHARFGWSVAIGIVWLGIVCGGYIVSLLVRAFLFSKRQAREQAERLELAARPLTVGPHHVVCGRVELDGADDVAIQIDIDQAVENHSSKNSKWHTWNETVRDTRKAPFYLVREDGETVYVEPPDDVFVVDEIETKYPLEAPNARVRFADVRRGETFFVYGDLERGPHGRAKSAYRDGSGWILRSPGHRMLLASEMIRDRYVKRISYLRLVGGSLLAAFVLLHALITLPFATTWLFGTQTTATVIDRGTWVTTSKNTKTTHYSLTVRTPANVVFTKEVNFGTYEAMTPVAASPTIPVFAFGDSPTSSYLGFAPTLPIAWLMIAGPLSVFAWLMTRAAYGNTLPWYDRKKLNEHGGAGHWHDPRPNFPVKGY